MSLNKFETDLNIIQKLDDEPNDVGGLSAAELKAKFDEAGNAVKAYINETLIPEVEDELEGIREDAATKEELADVVLGQIPDGSLTAEKLAPGAIDAYTKEETLSADTKALFGLDDEAVPDDAFKKTAESIEATKPKIGDIMTTQRTDLGDNWLLCNGAEYSKAEYPELAKLCPDIATRAYLSSARGTVCGGSFSYSPCAVGEGNGYLVCLSNTGSSTYYMSVRYSKDNGKTWYTGVSFSNTTIYSQYSVVKYFEEEELWVIAVCSSGAIMLYTSPDIEALTWNLTSSTIGMSYIHDLWKENGQYYIAGGGGTSNTDTSSTGYPVIAYTSSLLSPAWTTIRASTKNIGVQSFLRANGYYAFFGTNSTNRYVVYTTSLSLIWNETRSTVTNGESTYCVVYDENEGVWAYLSYTSDYHLCVHYTDSLDATEWNTVTTDNPYFVFSGASTVPFLLAHVNGVWLTLSPPNGSRLYVLPSLTDGSGWTEGSNFGYMGTYRKAGVRPFVTADESAVIFPIHQSSYYYHYVAFYPLGVPEITADQSYVYIKAKGDE